MWSLTSQTFDVHPGYHRAAGQPERDELQRVAAGAGDEARSWRRPHHRRRCAATGMMAFMACSRGWLPVSLTKRAWLAVAAMLLAGCGGPGKGPAGQSPTGHGHRPAASASASRTGLPAAPATTPGTGGATATPPGTGGATGAAGVPQPRHTVVVVMENHSAAQIIGDNGDPFINQLARRGALFTRSYAITHPSEPNYLALFSGSTQGIGDDSCPHLFSAPNLAADLIAAGRSFTGYAEGLPSAGSAVCAAGGYARKHAPWTDFSNVPRSASQPFASFPGDDFARLPTVSFVVPDLCDDMHDCGVPTGDAWLRRHMAGYAAWAMTHDSLLILTWDENDGSPGNQIATIFAGQMVRPGRYGERITHYNVLRTVEDAYRLRRDGHAAAVRSVTGIWRR
jgi:acid phosphatase